jgi:hypothetical protein
MGTYQTFVHGSEQKNVTSNNARSIDDLSPCGLSLQRKARSANVRQLKLIEKEESQPFKYQDKNGRQKSVDVGKRMVARLSLDNPDIKKGQPASKNTDQNAMMADYKSKKGLGRDQLVKGHLLNEYLGGKAKNANLYPITDGANSDHLGYVENNVKKLVLAGRTVQYEVDAGPRDGFSCNTDCEKSQFKCHYKTIDNKGESVDNSVTILSDIVGGRKLARGSVLDASGNYLKKGEYKFVDGDYDKKLNDQLRSK